MCQTTYDEWSIFVADFRSKANAISDKSKSNREKLRIRGEKRAVTNWAQSQVLTKLTYIPPLSRLGDGPDGLDLPASGKYVDHTLCIGATK